MPDQLAQDLLVTLRSLRRSPGFVVTAVLTIGIATAGVALIVSIIAGTVFAPGPYRDPARVITLRLTPQAGTAGQPMVWFTYDEFVALRTAASGAGGPVEDLVAESPTYLMMTGAGEPRRLGSSVTSGGAFALLGVPALLGRGLLPDDDRPGAPAVLVITEDLWRGHFGRDPGVLNRTVQIDGRPHTIVGVAPREFSSGAFHSWHPLRRDLYPAVIDRLRLSGRLRPGVTEAQAQAKFASLVAGLAAQRPDRFPVAMTVTFDHPALRQTSETLRQSLWTFLAAVGMLTLIACVNVAALLLARITARLKEFAVRVSMGAAPRELIRLQLIEAGTIALLGSLLGIWLAWVTLPAAIALIPAGWLPSGADITLSWKVLLFMAAATGFVAAASGAVPAWFVTRLDPEPLLRQGGKGSSSASFGRIWRPLVATEVALAMSLLVLTAIFVRSFLALKGVPLGFSPERVISLGVTLSEEERATPGAQHTFLRQVLERYRDLPGVEGASLGGVPIIAFGNVAPNFVLSGRDEQTSDRARVDAVGADYFATLKIPLVSGRVFDRVDEAAARPVAVVNRSFADHYLEGRMQGRQIRIPDRQAPDGQPAPLYEIVGIVGDVAVQGNEASVSARKVEPAIYVPFTTLIPSRHSSFVVRTAAKNPRQYLPTLQRELWAVNPDQPFGNVRTAYEEIQVFQIGGTQFRTMVITLFAGLSVLLAAGGVYGMLSYVIAREEREIGVRFALGATGTMIVRHVLQRGLRPALAGVAAGAVVAALFAYVVRAFIWRIAPWDPLAHGLAAALLLSIAALACYLPSRRAARINPLEALRAE